MNTECLSAALAVQEKKGQYYTPASALRALRPNDAIIKSLLLTSLRCAPQPELSGGWLFRCQMKTGERARKALAAKQAATTAKPTADEQPAAAKGRRQRRPSLARALREAKKAGFTVVSATIEESKVSLTFVATAQDSGGNELDQWMAKRHAN
jgi:hypothetical protein